MNNRMISNGMMCSNTNFVQKLADSGLELVHFSVYSCHEKVHDFLTDTPGSWKKLMMSITNALNSGIRVQINTVINHYNETHLDKTVGFLTKLFPPISHFVWNNLDPEMMRKTDTAWSTLPNFDRFKPSLNRALQLLTDQNKTFRVEKMPLCYMP
jgi:MoaA/NifB/PqqE/SkfB family radical SAM enzyme